MSSRSTAYVLPVHATSLQAEGVAFDTKALWESSRGDYSKHGTARTFYSVDGKGSIATLVSLGKDVENKTPAARDEALRAAVGIGIKGLQNMGDSPLNVVVDTAHNSHAAAEGAYLAQFQFSHLKTGEDAKSTPLEIRPHKAAAAGASRSELSFQTGIEYAKAQNLARELMELPGNILTPTAFCERVVAEFKGLANVEIDVRDEAWAAAKGMRTFLSVTRGTSEPARFLEIRYNGGAKGAQPLAFVGKGITFDSGGISLKESKDMKLMRGDMGGAAAVVSAALAIAKLKLPINLVVVTPLCENLPGPSANKPGDVIYAMNGKTVEIDNTDAEGRLILADALYYASSTFKPHTVIDCATLTGAMDIALGEIFTGVFSTDDGLWNKLHSAGEAEFDRFWRMPLDDAYGPLIYSSNADLCNNGGKPGGSCTAALFLKSFVHGLEDGSVMWAHVDCAGTMESLKELPYQRQGMTGRPTRALIEFVRRLSLGQ